MYSALISNCRAITSVMAAITRGTSAPINRAVNFWRRPDCMLNYSSRQVEPRISSWYTRYIGPPCPWHRVSVEEWDTGSWRRAVQNNDTGSGHTVPSGIAAVGEGRTFNYKLMTKPNPKILSSEGWGVLQGPEYISARIGRCLTRAVRAAIFSFSKCATT